jgi:hypothetical protein
MIAGLRRKWRETNVAAHGDFRGREVGVDAASANAGARANALTFKGLRRRQAAA